MAARAMPVPCKSFLSTLLANTIEASMSVSRSKSFSRRTPLMALGLFASASSLAYVAHEAAGIAATSQVRSALAHMPGVSAASVSADAWSGRVIIGGLKAQGVSIGQLSVSSAQARLLPSFITPAFALDGSAMAENVVIDAGIIKYKARKVEASGTTMSNSDLAALFDAASTVPVTERLAKFTAAAVTAQDVSAELVAGETSQQVAYRDVKLINIDKGKIGALSVSGADQTAKMPDGEVMHIKIGAMSGKNMDLAGIARFMTGVRTGDNEPMTTVYESFAAEGYDVALEKSGVNFRIGTISGRDFKMRPLKTPFSEFVAMVSNKEAMKDPEPEQITKMVGAALDMLGSFEFGLAEARDISVALPKGGEVNSIKLARFGLAGWGNGKIGEYAFEGFELDAPDGHMKLGRFALRGFNYKHVLDAVAEHLEQGIDSFESADPRIFIPTLDQISLTGVDLDVPDKKGEGNSADGKRITMALGKFEVNSSGFLGGIPTSINAALDNFTFDIANSKDKQLKDFIAMGYKKFDLSAKIDLAWSEASETLSLRQLTGNSVGMGKISVKGTFGNVTKEIFTGDTATVEAALLGALIKEADVRFENGGIVEKGLEQEARKQKKTADQLKKEAIGIAAVGIPGMLQNAPAAKDIANAVAKFIASPKSIHFGAKSAEGLGAADLALLGDPAALLKKLAVVASAND